MTETGSGTYKITSWDETPYHESEGGPKLARAEITQVYKGTLEGEACLQFLMVYRPDGTAGFTGVERFSGSIAGKTGSFIMIHSGRYEDATAGSNWCIVSGSGTAGLSGIEGSGNFSAEHGGTAEYTLEYQFA